MAPPPGPLHPPVETHRLKGDLRQAVYWVSGILFVPLALLLALRTFVDA